MLSKQLLSLIVGIPLIVGCSSSQQIAMEPAKILSRDVFTCKGLTENKRWVGVTDEFLPDKDEKVVVVARMAPEEKHTIVTYELTNPLGAVVITDTKRYPKEEVLGFFYDMTRLLKLGGEGEWRATVYSDGVPFGQAIFYIGEKIEEEGEGGPRYVTVGEESLTEEGETESPPGSEADRYGSYIREVTPELSLPATEGNSPANQAIEPAT